MFRARPYPRTLLRTAARREGTYGRRGFRNRSEGRRDGNFIEERSAIEVSGSSSDQRVTLSTMGMNDFTAKVKRATVRELQESQFAADVAEAASDLFEKFRRQASEIHERYYP